MTSVLIRQVQFVPLGAMLITMIAALFVPHYSSVAQHISELGIIEHPAAQVMPVAAIVAGASVCLFAMGLWLHPSKAFFFAPLAALIFGISFVSAGIYPTGTAMHGLYGLTMFYVLAPACFAAELPSPYRTRSTVAVVLAASTISMLYMWGLLSALEPQSMRGLTQRLGILAIFGWYPFAVAALRTRAQAGEGPSAANAARGA